MTLGAIGRDRNAPQVPYPQFDPQWLRGEPSFVNACLFDPSYCPAGMAMTQEQGVRDYLRAAPSKPKSGLPRSMMPS
jgi:hypothetical protein